MYVHVWMGGRAVARTDCYACCCPFSVAKARGSHLRVHFKHMREVAHTIKGMKVVKAKAFLNDVLQFKRAVPFTRCVTQSKACHALLSIGFVIILWIRLHRICIMPSCPWVLEDPSEIQGGGILDLSLSNSYDEQYGRLFSLRFRVVLLSRHDNWAAAWRLW